MHKRMVAVLGAAWLCGITATGVMMWSHGGPRMSVAHHSAPSPTVTTSEIEALLYQRSPGIREDGALFQTKPAYLVRDLGTAPAVMATYVAPVVDEWSGVDTGPAVVVDMPLIAPIVPLPTQELPRGNMPVDGPVVVAYSSPPTASAVPEPDTWLMLVVGMGLVGFVARRRRVNVEEVV